MKKGGESMQQDKKVIQKRLAGLKQHLCADAMKEVVGLVEDLTGLKDLGEAEKGPLPMGTNGQGITTLYSSLSEHLMWRKNQCAGRGHPKITSWSIGELGGDVIIHLLDLRAYTWDNP